VAAVTGVVTCMRVGVLFHVGLLVEAFVAERTGVRADVGVDHQMSGQRRRPAKRLAAQRAPVPTVSDVTTPL